MLHIEADVTWRLQRFLHIVGQSSRRQSLRVIDVSTFFFVLMGKRHGTAPFWAVWPNMGKGVDMEQACP
jgi:hypothetical protein